MRQTVLIFVLLLYSFCFAAEENVTISIEGMTCGACVQKVTQALTAIDGVKTADVKLKPGSATVVYEGDKTDQQNLLNAIAALGYKASADAMTAGDATHCKTEAEIPVKQAKTPASGCPMAKACAKAGTKPACATTALSSQTETAAITPKASATPETHACPTDVKCKELTDFHEAMDPLCMALGNADFTAIRNGYPTLAQKADALKNLNCAESCTANKKDFTQKRDNLIKEVANLGKAINDSDDKKLAKEFDKMHAAYMELGNLCVKKN